MDPAILCSKLIMAHTSLGVKAKVLMAWLCCLSSLPFTVMWVRLPCLLGTERGSLTCAHEKLSHYPGGVRSPWRLQQWASCSPLIFFEFFPPFMKWSLCPKGTRRMMGKGFEEGLLMLLIWPSHLLRWPNQMEKDRICIFWWLLAASMTQLFSVISLFGF